MWCEVAEGPSWQSEGGSTVTLFWGSYTELWALGRAGRFPCHTSLM